MAGLEEELYDLFVDDALAGRLHSPEGFLRRHGCDDQVLLGKLRLIYGQLSAGPGERKSLDAVPSRPEKIAGYVLLEPIGQGGFGEVFRARGPDGEVCALKLIRFAVRSSRERRERFLREIAAVRRLQQPNIVRVLSGGEVDGLVYLALELVPGQTLRARVLEAAPSPEEAVRWCLGVARALHYVHEQGLLHRDVKPGNVMLRPDGEPVLLDFGLVMDTLADLATLTRGFVGTAAFSAPEQLKGLRRVVSARSDLYGLAATLYFCLTGRPPFGSRGERRELQPVAGQHPELPPVFDALLARALAEDPAERPASVADFAAELEAAWQAHGLEIRRASADLPTLLSDPEAFERTHKTVRCAPSGKQTPVSGPPFALEFPIGRGGNGIVYRALQTRLDRPVAVKVVRDRAAYDWQGFVAEALLAGRLEHPNILPVYDLLQSHASGGQLAMKLVEGETWAVLLEREPADRDAHLEILCALCNAVAFAHSRGVLHNDLKPSNVLLGPFGEILLCDWGVAVELSGREGQGVRPQESIDAPCGTPAYMSPELATGDGAALSVRSDVFQLGGILYKILTGGVPNDRARLLGFLEGAVVGPPPLPEHAPEALAQLCSEALDPDPGRRPASAQAFLASLRSWFQHRESHQICQAALVKLRACKQQAAEALPARRDQLYERFSAVVAAFGAARELHETAAARHGEQEARRAFAAAAHRAGDFGLAQTQLSQLPAGDGASRQLRAELAQGVRQRDRDRRARRLLRGVLLGGAALFLIVWAVVLVLRERDAERVRQSYQAANAYAQSAMDGLYRVSANLGSELIEELGSTRSERAVRELRQAALVSWRGLLETGHGTDTRQQLLMHARIATLIRRLEPESLEAAQHMARAEELRRQLPEGDQNLPVTIELEAHRADWAEASERWSELEERALQGLQLTEQLVGIRPAEEVVFWRFRFLQALAVAFEQQSDLEGAVRETRAALAILQQAPDITPRSLFQESVRLAGVLRLRGQLLEARELLEPLLPQVAAWLLARESSVLRREVFSEVSWLLALVLDSLGAEGDARAMLAQALEHNQWLRARFPDFPEYRRRHASLEQSLAVLEQRLGRPEESTRHYAGLARVLAELDPEDSADEAVRVASQAALLLRDLRQVRSLSQAAELLPRLLEVEERLRESRALDARLWLELRVELLLGGVELSQLLGDTPAVAAGLEAVCSLLEQRLAELSDHRLNITLAYAWAQRASFLITLHELDEARACLTKVDEILGRVGTQGRGRRLCGAEALHARALMLELEGEREEARELCAQALELLEVLPASDPEAVRLRCELALRAGRLAEDASQAIEQLAQLLADLEQLERGVKTARLTAATLEELGWLLLASDPAGALELAERAGQIRSSQRREGLGGLESVRRCAQYQLVCSGALKALLRREEALEVMDGLYRDYLQLCAAATARWSDFHDLQVFSRFYASELFEQRKYAAAGEACAEGLRAGARVVEQGRADVACQRRNTALAALSALCASTLGDLPGERASQALAVQSARTALASFGPDAALEHELALVLGDYALSLLPDLPAEALEAASESLQLAERLGFDELAARGAEVCERAAKLLAGQ